MYFAPLQMREVLASVGPAAREALAALLPGPVTVVVDNPERRFPLAGGEAPERLGLRLIEGPLAGAAVAAMQSSANPSGGADPRSLDAVDPALRAAADLAIDAGELPGTPSTVVDVSGLDREEGGWRLLREGALSEAEVERRLGPLLSSPGR